MKRIVLGILAHVDSGKTTLTESILYNSGEIRKLGRVDHGDAFLDTNIIEKERGITIFSKQAILKIGDTEITILDTPGHIDFSAEMERALSVLDYAVLVISGTSGVQSHTETLWKLLSHYNIPTFIFVNKMDISEKSKSEILKDIKDNLSNEAVIFDEGDDSFYENAALCDELLLDEFTNCGELSSKKLATSVAMRNIFPCFFGSALKNDGIKELMDNIDKYTLSRSYPSKFGAKVFKISDDNGTRLTHLKITGGTLKMKMLLEGDTWSQKVNEIRIYSGEKYRAVQEATAGTICAVVGLSEAKSGEGLGIEADDEKPLIEPVFSYVAILPKNIDAPIALSIFKKLEAEESQLHIEWNEELQQIEVQIMGEIQLEILKRILSDRFSLDVEFEHGNIIYKETINNTVEGVGHYEPLRHYAEVHLILEPNKRDRGIEIQTKCSEDILDKNWQRLIKTHLLEKKHLGVLTGSPITDIKISIINGRAHKKHTVGGDFRQATYRAVRQGLMNAESILLEPWYSFSAEVPMECTGRLMTDLEMMGAKLNSPETTENITTLTGIAPLSKLRTYRADITAYSKGRGKLSYSFYRYDRCVNQDEVIAKTGYNPESDIYNSPDSVFCANGSGFTVKWDKVYDYMHIPLYNSEISSETSVKVAAQNKIYASDEELLKIFEQTYGKIKSPKVGKVLKTEKITPKYKSKSKNTTYDKTYLLIDGYNIIFAWDELKKAARDNLGDARDMLISKLCNYKAIKDENIILVFDAYKVKGNDRETEEINGINIVYTKEAETADSYIEKTSRQLSKNYRVKVATSDNLVQLIIFGDGATRISARDFLAEVTEAENEIRRLIREKK